MCRQSAGTILNFSYILITMQNFLLKIAWMDQILLSKNKIFLLLPFRKNFFLRKGNKSCLLIDPSSPQKRRTVANPSRLLRANSRWSLPSSHPSLRERLEKRSPCSSYPANTVYDIEVQFWFFYFANEEILVGGKKFNIKKYFEF